MEHLCGNAHEIGVVEPEMAVIKFSLYSRYCAEACNEWRGPSPRLSAWSTQLRRNVAEPVASMATLCPI